MKYLIFLVFGFLSAFTHAQIVITQSDMPSANETILYSNASLNSLNFVPTQTGANYDWNFSNLIKDSEGIYEYKNSLSTPYLLYFFNKIGLKTASSIGISSIQLTDIYSFYTKNSSVFKTEGLGYSYSNIPLSNAYIDEDEVYQFPLQYGDHDSSTYYFDYNLSSYTTYLDYAQNGSRVNDVDGWGSIVTPYNTYTNVIRLKTTIYTHDTITLFGFPVITSRKTIDYKWLSKNEKIPVLEINGSEVSGVYTTTGVKYRDGNSTLVGLKEDGPNLSFISSYPNPFKNQLTIRTENNVLVVILNASGDRIFDAEISDEASLNTELFPPGLYFIQLINNGKLVLSQKVIKQ